MKTNEFITEAIAWERPPGNTTNGEKTMGLGLRCHLLFKYDSIIFDINCHTC